MEDPMIVLLLKSIQKKSEQCEHRQRELSNKGESAFSFIDPLIDNSTFSG
jgi:hypothetical protein